MDDEIDEIDEIPDLDGAIETYDKIMQSNYAKRVELMPEQDLDHYFRLHNLPSPDKGTVLQHMNRWGGFNGLVLQEGLRFFQRSALMQRLIAGRKPLPFPPPRKQGVPWYELIDEPGHHPCLATGVIRNRRLHRHTWKELILLVEDCPWEIVDANTRAGSLLDAQVRFQFPENSRDQPEAIYEATQIARAAGNMAAISCVRAEVSIHYGQWPQSMTLYATGPRPRNLVARASFPS